MGSRIPTRAPSKVLRPEFIGMLTLDCVAGMAAAFLLKPERPGHICIFALGKQLPFKKFLILCILNAFLNFQEII
jgi:hypothetical protein